MTRQQLSAAALMCLFAWVVFATQSGGTGFWYKFHGGVSVHGLAIMSRATPANAFVGNSRTLINADDSLRPEYFDRYPVFFSVLVGALINLAEDLSTKVFIARQVMNAVFVLTMLFAWLLLWRLSGQRLLALAIIALACSGYWLLYYRDMIHYDQPALLGMLVLLHTIARGKAGAAGALALADGRHAGGRQSGQELRFIKRVGLVGRFRGGWPAVAARTATAAATARHPPA